MDTQKIIFLAAAALLFLSAASGADWLDKPAWQDRPVYAQDLEISISPTDLIQERESREVCASYSNETLENGSTIETCDSYENETFAGANARVFNITGRDVVYLGDGYVRSEVTVGLNTLSQKTLEESTLVLTESEYVDWFNDNYLYDEGNITSAEVDELQGKVTDLSGRGENTVIVASRVNSIDLVSRSADMTLVFQFNDFRSGVLTVSDLFTVEVESSIA
jgi:hypothetical protein